MLPVSSAVRITPLPIGRQESDLIQLLNYSVMGIEVKRKASRRILVSITWVIFFASVACQQTQKPASKPVDEVQVLFIGNSLTYYHEMPSMLADLAKAGKQRPLRFEQETPGGYPLEGHWKDQRALGKIRSRKWDFVILQENSAGYMNQKSMVEYGVKFDAQIKKQGAKTLLYATWATKDNPQTQKLISEAYLKLAKETNAKVAPVGKAWEEYIALKTKLDLHDEDGLHPSAAGSYLAACVFYSAIYGKSPEGLSGSIAKLTDEEARPLQIIAWEVVEKSEK
jgi:hypothetical protein